MYGYILYKEYAIKLRQFNNIITRDPINHEGKLKVTENDQNL